MSLPNTKYGFESINGMLKKTDSIFFLGIGGVSMSSLAHMSAMLGFKTGGYDRTPNELTQRLEKEGIDIKYTSSPDNVCGYGALVYTIAMPESTPEYLAARNAGIPCFSRADFMGYLINRYNIRIGISGMHGKSTCTSMVAHAMISAGLDPTVLSGAALDEMGGTYRIGTQNALVFEACEYKDSFLSFFPKYAVILNVEMDHVDYFKSMEQIIDSFTAFIRNTDANGGAAVINRDDDNVMLAAKKANRPTVTFGIEAEADYRAQNICVSDGKYCFDVKKKGQFLCSVKLGVPGRHNVYNALACIAVCDLSGANVQAVASSFENFKGAKRRLEYKGKLNGADLFDDYAHHPTEIKASVDAIRDMGYSRIICAFQPHTYSRTAELLDDFGKALSKADKVIIADIFEARETNTYGISIQKLAEATSESAEPIGALTSVAKRIKELAQPNDAVIIMGAGDISDIFALL